MDQSKFNSIEELREKPNNHMALSIIATIFSLCSFWCTGFIIGVIAIVMSSQSTSKYNKGDYSGSLSAAKTAKILALIAFVIGLATYAYTFYTIQQAGGIEIFIEEFKTAIEQGQYQ
ncbi:CD225/dispanin family protein [Myroides sp. LJL115]